MEPVAQRPTEEESPTERGKPAVWLVLCRLSVLVALIASAALYLQYLMPAQAAFCGLESGCEAVRRAGFSYFFGSSLLSIPLVGLLAYGAVLWASLVAPEARLTVWVTAAGGVAGLVLLGAQAFVVHAFCWLCVTADVAGFAAGSFAVLHDRAAPVSPPPVKEPLRRWAWIALAVVGVGVPAAWVKVKPAPPVPPSVLALYEPGKVNVVEFADFECPYCRRFHPVLRGVLGKYPAARVRFVRRHVPLPSHEDARPAARAAVCAEAQGLGEKLAERLVAIELSPAANRRAALEVGVNPSQFDECLASSEPDRRIDADTLALEQAGMRGLPTTYVQGKLLLGAVSEAAVRDALDHALRGDTETGIPGPIFVPLALLALLAVAWLGRSPHGKLSHERTS